MLIIQLTGGLGNQMFQYAASKALAIKLNTELYLDKTHFFTTPMGKKNLRSYELSQFSIDQKFRQPTFHWIKKYLKVKQVYSGFKTYVEPHVHFSSVFFNITDKTYIEGFFQSEKYFKDYEAEIRNDFKFKNPPQGLNLELFKKIQGCNAVSVHVRRGDYVNNPETLKLHGICGLDYYQNAVELIAEKVENPYFFLFSDEPEWVQKNLKLSHPYEVISHNKGASSFEDMRLMSTCKHNIIANSSFSWWGAWLNNNLGKTVIAPKHWFVNPNWDSKDIIPNSWIKI
jgi:hypothetical protein